MGLNGYMKLTGETQGNIRGSVTKAGFEDSIKVIAVNHGVGSPVDAVSGLPTGKRQHEPLTITKEIDRSTPLLMNLLTNSENIQDLEVLFCVSSRDGMIVPYYKIELVNARIYQIQFEMLNNKHPGNYKLKECEHISFCYQKIIWTYVDDGSSSEDDWEAPNV